MELWRQAYVDARFDSVELQVQMEIAGELVLLYHFPYRAEAEPKQKYYGQRPVDGGGWLIHGHVHNRWKNLSRQQLLTKCRGFFFANQS